MTNEHRNITNCLMSNKWAVITGAGTGIGAALAVELAKHRYHILAIGRRLQPLQNTKEKNPDLIHVLQADIATDSGMKDILGAIPAEDEVSFLVQNAAVGEPGRLGEIDEKHFELALKVNVTAPLMLTQGFLARLKKRSADSNGREGRIVHLGTGVAYRAQKGTTTYGVSKMAFQRLFDQLLVECLSEEVRVGVCNILPGVVDTEGLWEHYKIAKDMELEHTKYFDHCKETGSITSAEKCAEFIAHVMLEKETIEDFSKQWPMKDWVR